MNSKTSPMNLQSAAEFRVILDLSASAQRKHFKKAALAFYLSKMNPSRYPYTACMTMTKIALVEVFHKVLNVESFECIKDLPSIKRMIDSEKQFLKQHFKPYKK